MKTPNAEVHKVETDPNFGNLLDEYEVETTARPVPKPCDGSCQGMCDEHDEAAQPAAEPLARVWIRPGDAEYSTTPLNYDNDDSEYVHLDPIRKVLAKCREIDMGDCIEIPKADWEKLCEVIKGT